jgi:AraC-like DNA-binding protein
MTTTLPELRNRVLAHLAEDTAQAPLGGVGIFHSRRAQSLHNVPIHHPLMVLVTSGRKVISLGERKVDVLPGELLLLPGGCSVEVGNHPGRQGEDYLGLAIAFSEESIALFRRNYGAEQVNHSAAQWSAPAPDGVVTAMAQWVDWCMLHPNDPALVHHRQVEFLLLLARAGVAGNLLLNREASWRERVAQLLALDPSRDWCIGEVCRRLGIGESTLRRRLQAEGSGFRQALEETRMVAALALLQETFWPVGQVAAAVGYISHSRFSERFKRRFGLSPTELKKTRESGTRQKMSD